jgi:hypothetical protein
MRRPLVLLTLVAALSGFAVPAQAQPKLPPVPGPDCLPVPDDDGHVWYLCNWKPW